MKIIGCEIFRRELEIVAPQVAGSTTWLPAGLHVNIQKLGDALANALDGDERVFFLYGACHPDIDAQVSTKGACRFPGNDCIAAFLPGEVRKTIEGRRAMIITPGWLRHWRDIFKSGLSWDNDDARQNFGFYDVIILLDFGIEPLDDIEILEFFDFTNVPVEVFPASLEFFRLTLKRLLDKA